PGDFVAGPGAGDQTLVAYHEVGVRLEEVKDARLDALIVRRLAQCEEPLSATDVEFRRSFNVQDDWDFVVGVDGEVEGLGVAVISGHRLEVGVLGRASDALREDVGLADERDYGAG